MQLRFSKIQEQQNLQLYIFCQYAFDNKGSTKLTRTENDRQKQLSYFKPVYLQISIKMI